MISYVCGMPKKTTDKVLPNRLRELREAKHWTQSEVAQKYAALTGADIKYQTIQKWENGTNKMTIESVKVISQIFECSPDEIILDWPAQKTHENTSIMPLASPRITSIRSSHLSPTVPVYGPAAAGDSTRILFTDEFIREDMERPAELENVREAAVMVVAGDSMRPKYRPNQRVAIHMGMRPYVIEEDCIIVMEEDGNALLKEYAGETETEWKVKQYNPEKTYKIKKSECRAIYLVVGRPSR